MQINSGGSDSLNWDVPAIGDTERELPAEGNYNAVICGVIYAGVQPSKFREQGARTIYICVELDSEIKKGPLAGKRHRMWRRVNYTLSQTGTLYSIVVAALGKAFPRTRDGKFQPATMVGRPVMCEVVYTKRDGRTYADLGAIGRHVRGLPVLAPNGEVTVPQWIQDRIAQRLDKPPAPPTPPVPAAPAASPAAEPAPPATAAAAAEGDGIERWAQSGYCQAGKEEEVGVECDA
jgi:hypothetical protein